MAAVFSGAYGVRAAMSLAHTRAVVFSIAAKHGRLFSSTASNYNSVKGTYRKTLGQKRPGRSNLSIPAELPIFQVYGANTDVGKTVVSAGLIRSALRNDGKAVYIKPVQTGMTIDIDFVKRASSLLEKSEEHTLLLSSPYRWAHPVSPHLAATLEGKFADDATVVDALRRDIEVLCCRSPEIFTLVETAGGVLSPGPSGTLQADIYRPLRLPTILVADGKLGGISQTLCSYESLMLRGYDVLSVIFVGLSHNIQYFKEHTTIQSVYCLPDVPPQPEPLDRWWPSTDDVFDRIREDMLSKQKAMLASAQEMSTQASTHVWWPFTQHQHSLDSKSNPLIIDSAHGDNFTVLTGDDKIDTRKELFDSCASWWTQGVIRGDSNISLAMAYATGRYGHVMFPNNMHQPAYDLCKLLLNGVGKSWAQRVFFSDNGSTAIEIALKMAFRKFAKDHAISGDAPLRVVSLEGCYHGDTLGAMDVATPNPFNANQHPWFNSKTVAFNPPSVACVKGKYCVHVPEEIGFNETITFSDHHQMVSGYDADGRRTDAYRRYISKVLDEENKSAKGRLGCLLIEPILMGAGGMIQVDTLFQRVLVEKCRSRGMPVVYDEVFSGMYRLGVESAIDYLQVRPDISCYAKLLTGGTVPMAVTLTSEAVFESFLGTQKADALLHGHSYAANPIGCAAAVAAINTYRPHFEAKNGPLEVWQPQLTEKISNLNGVKRALSLGSVFAVELDSQQTGYASHAAAGVVAALRPHGIYARSLGNVVYLMASPLSEPQECLRVQSSLHEVLAGPAATTATAQEASIV